MSALSKLLRFRRSTKAPSVAFTSLLSPKPLGSANSFLPKEPTFAFLGFCKTSREIFTSTAFGSRSFSSENEFEMKKGDWTCSKCKFINFARNIRCLKCKTDGPSQVDVCDDQKKPGDWACPKCRYMNFAKNKTCLRCREPAPKRVLNPGEWECPSCDYINFRKNTACLRCHVDKPKKAAE